MTRYFPTLSTAAADEHIHDLLRAASIARDSASLNPAHPRPRYQQPWWVRTTNRVRGGTARAALRA
jgi:hypothetical protein